MKPPDVGAELDAELDRGVSGSAATAGVGVGAQIVHGQCRPPPPCVNDQVDRRPSRCRPRPSRLPTVAV